MAFSIPTIEPLEHEAGTSLIFTRSFTDYPASVWTLSYSLVNITSSIESFSATADGNTHAINVGYAVTETWPAGKYRMRGYVTDGTDRHTVYDGWITILPYIGDGMPQDTRSFARRMLEAIEDGLQTSAGQDVVSYSINGRSITKLGWTEAANQYNYWRARVRWEERQTPVKIKVRFT